MALCISVKRIFASNNTARAKDIFVDMLKKMPIITALKFDTNGTIFVE